MSESEMEKEGTWNPECFSTYDENFKECTEICELRERCKAHTKKKAVPMPASEKEEFDVFVEEMPEMEPRDYLVETLKGRYDVASKDTEKGFMVAARKDGKLVIRVIIAKSGKCLIEVLPTGVTLQILSGLESNTQVMHIAKALLVI